jgi:hypothetical protein
MDIRAIPNTAWRNDWVPASFRGQYFHCALNATQGGQRVVTHEFPKKDYPYAEKMGRRAMEFTIRGYIIAYPHNTVGDPLKQRDYRIARDALKQVLDQGNEGLLQLNFQQPMVVVCSRYSLTEDDKLGGYCTFDMTFIELGSSPLLYTPDTQTAVIDQSQDVRWQALNAGNELGMTPAEKAQYQAAINSGSSNAVAKVWSQVLAAHNPANQVAPTNP